MDLPRIGALVSLPALEHPHLLAPSVAEALMVTLVANTRG